MQTILSLITIVLVLFAAGWVFASLRRWFHWLWQLGLLVVRAVPAGLVALPMVLQPGDVPSAWRPWTPLQLDDALNPVARMKVRAMALDGKLCRAALAGTSARTRFLADTEDNPNCHIRNRVQMTGLSAARMTSVDTRCEMAARLYLWERHALQPLAQRFYGTGIVRIEHYSSYSCRKMRTSRGTGSRWSQHATANAIDISGFVLEDGRRIPLVSHWDGPATDAAFLRAARDGLCEWFNMVLSPDYNALHADHFHVDMGPFPGCR